MPNDRSTMKQHQRERRRRRSSRRALSDLVALSIILVHRQVNLPRQHLHHDHFNPRILMVAQALLISPSLIRQQRGSSDLAAHSVCHFGGAGGRLRHSSSQQSTPFQVDRCNHRQGLNTALFVASRVDNDQRSAAASVPNLAGYSDEESSSSIGVSSVPQVTTGDINDFPLRNGNQDDGEQQQHNHKDSNSSKQSAQPSSSPNAPFDSWLDRTTARLLNIPPDEDNKSSQNHIPSGQLTPDDVSFITTLMTSHARRSTVASAITCERLLKRVVEEVNDGNTDVAVTTKMYTVAMDAWAKSQRRPLPGSGVGLGVDGVDEDNNTSKRDDRGTYGFEGKKSSDKQQNQRQRQKRQTSTQKQLQLHPQQLPSNIHINKHSPQLPLGAAAQRAHRIHNSLVQTYKQSGDPNLAPSTISYNAAINAWSKSYHPSAGEMAELLLGEMLREWRVGEAREEEGRLDDDDDDDDDRESVARTRDREGIGRSSKKVGNERVKPDVVTFTAVIDAWVKCTALAHDYHYHGNNNNNGDKQSGDNRENKNKESYVDWKRSQAAKADELTQRAATRAKQLLELMITLGHYDPERHGPNNGETDGRGIDDKVAESQDSQNSSKAIDADSASATSLLLANKHVEPGMRPNCYTYSAVMNALAKSCSALRCVDGNNSNHGQASNSRTGNNYRRRQQQQQQRQSQQQYDPAQGAQDMLESMIEKHERYKERVGEDGIWKSSGGASVAYFNSGDDGEGEFMLQRIEEREGNDGDERNKNEAKDYEKWIGSSWSSTDATMSGAPKEAQVSETSNNLAACANADGDTNITSEDDDTDIDDIDANHQNDPYWFEPRPNELTFPPNTINYNSVLNAWSRASRYDAHAAARAEHILVERMEKPQVEGGDAVEPDALSYSLVIHAWLRGCRGSSTGATTSSVPVAGRGRQQRGNDVEDYTDQDRIERAMAIVDRLEAWARRTHSHNKWRSDDNKGSFGKGDASIDEDDDHDHISSSGDMDVLDDVQMSGEDEMEEDTFDSEARTSTTSTSSDTSSSSYTFRQHNKARDLDVEVYNSILVAYSREQTGDHAASVMNLLDRMEALADELDMPSVRPNQRSYNIALGVISNSATRANTSLRGYYEKQGNDEGQQQQEASGGNSRLTSADSQRSSKGGNNSKKKNHNGRKGGSHRSHHFNPLYAGQAAESILGRMLLNNHRPDAYTFASVLNTYQRIPDGRLDAALAADAVVRGMESLHLHGKIDDPPDVFHYTMVCACWSRSGEGGVAGERCSEILRHMHERDREGFPRVRPNIRTYNAVIDSHAYNGRVAEAEDMLLSMVDNYQSSASRSMDGIEDEELPVRPDSFSFNTVIQQWARARTPDAGRKAERILERLLQFHHDGNADVRPDERSFAYIIYHYCKGAGRMDRDAPDRALKLLRRMIGMYKLGYKELLPSNYRANPIFSFTSVIDAHSVLRRPDSGVVGDELLSAMTRLGEKIDALRPSTYVFLSVLYAWSSCGSVDAGEKATELLQRMEEDMEDAAKRGEDSTMRTTQRCYILAQTAWARSPSARKAEGALEVLEMMERNYANGNMEAKPTIQAYSMVLNACAFADMVQDENGKLVKAPPQNQQKAFHIAELTMNRIRKEPYPGVLPNPVIYGTFIKCCGRLDIPDKEVAIDSAVQAFEDCRRAGMVSDFVLTQLRYALGHPNPEKFLNVLAKNGYEDVLDGRGKSLSRDGKRIRPIRVGELPKDWTKNANADNKNRR